MANKLQHKLLTGKALDLLAPHFRLPNKIHEALVENYCCYPDDFFTMDENIYEKISPYIFIKDGIQFHYLPDIPLLAAESGRTSLEKSQAIL